MKIPDEGISLDPFDDATLKLFESALPPGISIEFANTILEIPKRADRDTYTERCLSAFRD